MSNHNSPHRDQTRDLFADHAPARDAGARVSRDRRKGATPTPATAEERSRAMASARAMRAMLADLAPPGERMVVHIHLSRPRRGMWIETWSNLPGLTQDCATGAYTHSLLPGWQYTAEEMRTEMIEDLERLADTGEQPKVATR